MVGMRVIPVGAGRARQDGELVVVRGARRDGAHRAAVRRGGNVQAVPVDGGRLGEMVVHVDDDVVAFAELQRGTGHLAVEREGIARVAGRQRQPGRRDGQRQLDGARRGAFLGARNAGRSERR